LEAEAGIDTVIGDNRKILQKKRVMALGQLVYSALSHAAVAVSHPDQTLEKFINVCKSKSVDQWMDETKSVGIGIWTWAKANVIKVSLMVIGLGISAFKANAISQYMLSVAAYFCAWCKRKPLPVRFLGFVALMSVRLIVSTLVPPTSPGFGIIIQAATPDEEKWTAMPCFLLASAVAGAWPWIFDKLASLVTQKDFWFTMRAKRFADNYPLTCWTGPAMREAFQRVYGDGGDEHQKERNGKLGASFAVVVGHVVPFMGAQTTIMQRYFLPHPLDTIVSQPFGMTEDLVSMALAEATSNPVLASWSLTVLIVFFNFARGLIFSGRWADVEKHATPDSSAVGAEGAFPAEEPNLNAPDEGRDYVALVSAFVNILVGAVIGHVVAGKLSLKAAFCAVAVQMMVQLLVVPIVLRHSSGLLVRLMQSAEQSAEERQGCIQDSRWSGANGLALDGGQQRHPSSMQQQSKPAGTPPVHEGRERSHDSWPLEAAKAGRQGVVAPTPASQVPPEDGFVSGGPQQLEESNRISPHALKPPDVPKLPAEHQPSMVHAPKPPDGPLALGQQPAERQPLGPSKKLPHKDNPTDEWAEEKRMRKGEIACATQTRQDKWPEPCVLQHPGGRDVTRVGRNPTQPRGGDVAQFKRVPKINDSPGKLPQTQNLTKERENKRRRSGENVVNNAPNSNAMRSESPVLQQPANRDVASVGQSPIIDDMPGTAQAVIDDLRGTPTETGRCSFIGWGCCTPVRAG